MGDQKLSELTVKAQPESGDLLYIVDPAEELEADRSKATTFGALLSSVIMLDGDIVTLDDDIVTL